MSGARSASLPPGGVSRLRAGLASGSAAVRSTLAERLALVGVAIGMAASAATLLVLNSGLTFFNDEYGWLSTSRDFEPRTLLMPHNGHLIAFPRLFYTALPEVFGPGHLPFALLSVISVLLCAGLFFAFARRRVGGLVALAPTLVLPFFGSSWDVVLATVGIPALLSMAGGLGALVALDRDSRNGDLAAAILLAVSLASHSFGPVFTAGAAIYVLLRGDRWRRLWVVAIPGVLYAAWWAWALQFDQGVVSAANVPGLPRSMASSLEASLAALTGLNSDFGAITPPVTQPTRFVTTYNVPLAIAGIAAVAVRIRLGRVTPWLWALLALTLFYWLAVGLSESPARQPESARYLLMGAVMILLIGAESLRGVRLGWGPVAILFVLAGTSLAGNLTHLRNAHNLLVDHAADARAQLAMLELGRGQGSPTLQLARIPPSGARYVPVSSLSYLALADRVGSLAEPLAEVRDEPEPVREGADLVLARYLGVGVEPRYSVAGGIGCRSVAAGEEVTLRPGDSFLHALRGGGASLLVGRFADAPSVPAGELSGRGVYELSIPADAAPDPWRAEADGAVELCR